MKIAAHGRTLQPAIDSLKAVHFGENGDNSVFLHRREIVRREGCFSVLANDEARAAFDADLIRLFEDQPYQVMTVTIDKRDHLDRYKVWRFDPYHYCLMCMVERYAQWMERNNLCGDVMAEARFKHVDKKVKASFRRIWAEGTDRVSADIMQRRLLSRDIKLATKASNVAGLQLADLLAHPSYRAMKMAREGAPAPEDFGTRVASILTQSKYARHPTSKQIDGWGLKWLP